MGRMRFGIFLAPFHPAGENPTLRTGARPRAHPAPGSAGLRRGMDRRAPLRRQRDHRLAGDLHRRGGRAHAPHQARHRRHVDRVPQPTLGGRAHGAPRPPHTRAHDARRRPWLAADRLGDDRPQPDRHARAARRQPRHHHAAAARRRAGHRRDPDAQALRRAPAPAPVLRAALRHRRRGGRIADRARASPAATASACSPWARPSRPRASTPSATTGGSWRSAPPPSAQTVDREKWRLVGLVHAADTKEQAYKDVEHGIEQWFRYFEGVAAFPQMGIEGEHALREMVDFVNESGVGAIGTWEDVAAQIEKLDTQSNGGFGCYLMLAHEWANPVATQALLRAHRPARHAALPGPRAADDRRARTGEVDPRGDGADAERRGRAHDREVRARGRGDPRLGCCHGNQGGTEGRGRPRVPARAGQLRADHRADRRPVRHRALAARGSASCPRRCGAEKTQGALAAEAALDKTTMVVTVDELERAGLAERRPSTTDRRVRIIAVTPEGERLVRRGRRDRRRACTADVLDRPAGGGARGVPRRARPPRRRPPLHARGVREAAAAPRAAGAVAARAGPPPGAGHDRRRQPAVRRTASRRSRTPPAPTGCRSAPSCRGWRATWSSSGSAATRAGCGWSPDRDRERPAAWDAFAAAMAAPRPPHGLVKLQVTGPATLATALEGPGADAVSPRRSRRGSRRTRPGRCAGSPSSASAPCSLVDEPGLDGAGIADPVVYDPLRAAGAAAWGVHVCGPVPWPARRPRSSPTSCRSTSSRHRPDAARRSCSGASSHAAGADRLGRASIRWRPARRADRRRAAGGVCAPSGLPRRSSRAGASSRRRAAPGCWHPGAASWRGRVAAAGTALRAPRFMR